MLFLPKEIETVITTLQGAGYSPYLVGGCVREMLRGKAPSDYDMTSDALPQEVLRLFGEWAHPTGLQHGTVTVVSGGLPIELTTMRRDGAYRDNRHPDSVTFGTSIEEDLARRDFTVNAIALSPDGTLVDPYGGQEDLKAGVLRCVGEPKRRFEEDALRILRLVRFCSVLGFSAEKETARAAHEARGLLARVAHERVYTEMNKLLLGEDVGETLLTFPDILGVPIPEILPCVGFDQCNYHHCFDVWGHTARAVAAVPPKRELRWTMLFHDLGKPLCRTFDEQGIGHFYGHTAISAQMAEDIMARLHFEKALRDRIRAQLACFDDMFRPERAAIHKEMARLGAETVQNLLYTKQADIAAKAPAGLERAQALWHEAQKIYDELISEGACCSIHELKISGEDLAALGYHGREIGAVLARLLDDVGETLLTFPDILGVPIPEILPCVGFDQCNYHHCFDVWGHTARAVAAVPPKRELRWTMLFHDLGKPLCRTFDEQGIGHFYGHTAISAQMAEDIMARLHFEKALRDRIRAQLACFDDMFRPERAAIHKEMARLGAETVQNLLYTKQADIAAKAPAGLERAQALWHEAQKIYDELISEGACCSIHELKISGEDLAALGYHGREIGAVLARLLDEVAAEKLPNKPEALQARAVRLWRSGYARHTMKENETH